MDIKNIIEKWLLDSNGNPNSQKKKSWFAQNPDNSVDIFSELLSTDLRSITDKNVLNLQFYKLYTDNHIIPKCDICGSENKFISFKSGYTKYCSKRCASTVGATTNASSWKTMSDAKKASIQNKRKKTCIEKYGVGHVLQEKSIVQKLKENRKQKDYESTIKLMQTKLGINNVEDHNYWKTQCSKHLSMRSLADAHNVYFSDLYRLFEKIEFDPNYKRSSSGGEKELFQFVKSIVPNLNVLSNDRKALNGKEIDVYIPDMKFGIEFDGLYYHKDAKQIEKRKLAESVGVDLIFIFEDEWYEKRKIVESIIKSKLGLIEYKIFARKTQLSLISKEEAKKFCEENHIDGYANAKIHKGLYYDGKLVSVATFGASRFGEKKKELIRFCSLLNHTVVGGFSKLVSGEGLFVTYANKRFSTDPVYAKFGNKLPDTPPGYFWCKGTKRYNRMKFQKSKLTGMSNYDISKTETQIMEENKYWKVYDCGNYKFEITS